MEKIRVAISGYGNLGKGVENAIKQNKDMVLTAVVSRRKDLKIATEGVKIVSFDDVLSLKGEIDVLIICGGSATDLPEMTPFLAKHFTVVDSFAEVGIGSVRCAIAESFGTDKGTVGRVTC